MAKFYLETPWDVAPDSTSTYAIYPAEDMWIVGNAVEPTYKYDLNHLEELEGNAPKGKFFIVYKRMLMVAGNDDFPHRIFYSHINNAEGWTRDTSWIDIYPEDGGAINGLAVVQDELVISKANGRKYGWFIGEDGNPVNSRLRMIESDKGDISRKGGTVLDDTNYYMDWEGLFSIPRKTKNGNVTYAVKEVFDGINTDNSATIAVGSNDGKVYTSIGDVTFDADSEVSLNEVTVVHDSLNDAEYLLDNLPARAFTRFITAPSGREEIYFGDNEAAVYKLNTGNRAGLLPITMRIRTKAMFKDDPNNIVIKRVGVLMKDPDGTQVFARTRSDEGFVVQLGEVLEQPIHWLNVEEQVGEVPFFQMEFVHSGDKVRPVLQGYIIDYRIAGKQIKV